MICFRPWKVNLKYEIVHEKIQRLRIELSS